MNVTTPDGLQVVAEAHGPESAPGFVFIHGLLQAGLCWKLQLTDPRFSGYRCVAYDLRGHGASDKPLSSEYYTEPHRWADELAAVIEVAKVTRPILVGWSYGGRVLLDYVRDYGTARLGGLVFASVRVTAGKGRRLKSVDTAIARTASSDLGEMIAGRLQFLAACFNRRPPRRLYDEMIAYNMLTPVPVLQHIRKRGFGYDEVLERIDVKTLVIHGTRDKLSPPELAEYTASRIPHARCVIYDGVGHSPFIERTQQFNDELLALRRSVD